MGASDDTWQVDDDQGVMEDGSDTMLPSTVEMTVEAWTAVAFRG